LVLEAFDKLFNKRDYKVSPSFRDRSGHEPAGKIGCTGRY